jgi:TATA-box binding protein (TBP) (component of TFIID and TFIIIB)
MNTSKNTLKTFNIKCHIKLNPDDLKKVIEKFYKCLKCEEKETDLCCCICKVYRWEEKIKVFLYIESRTLNFTGIASFDHIQETIEKFCHFCNISKKHIVIIDNSTSSLKICRLHLYRLAEELNQLKSFNNNNIIIKRVTTNLEKFPAVRVKTNIGSLNFFSSGSIIILGVKNKQNLSILVDFVQTIERNNV